MSGAAAIDGLRIVTVKVDAADMTELQSLGDEIRGELNSGVAFLFSSHDSRMIERAARRIRLVDGSIVSDGVEAPAGVAR